MTQFSELPEQEQEKWMDAARDVLDGTLVCMRVWEAWGYGTMSESDFIDSIDDEDFVFERAIEIYKATEAMQAENARLRYELELLKNPAEKEIHDKLSKAVGDSINAAAAALEKTKKDLKQ